MNQKNIAVLFGGCSPEYKISLQSAYSVICHMDRSKYTPVPIGISPEGRFYQFEGDLRKIGQDTWCTPSDCTPVAVSPDPGDHGLLLLGAGMAKRRYIDAAFPVLHGKNGEDGTVQGIFTLAGIPLVGCGVLASALCMDKDRAHRLAQTSGIEVATSFVLTQWMNPSIAAEKANALGYPLFVKPIRAGSSYGVSKVVCPTELSAAIDLAFAYDEAVIIEECIPGFEVGCAVLGNDDLFVGEIDEIELSDGFFDYTEKYTLKTSAIHVPARIDRTIAEKIKETAKSIYRTLDCRGFARVDLFLTPDGRIVFNEVNTIPGFTSHSRFPNMLRAAGMPFEQMISAVIELAVGA